MIYTLFLDLAYYVLGFFLSIFPVSDGYPVEVTQAFQWIGGFVGMLDPLVPVGTLLVTVSLAFTVELLVFGFKLLSWIFSKIPVIGK